MAADAAADEQLAVRELAGIGRPNPVELKEALIQTLPSLKAGPFIVLNQLLVFKHESNIQVLSQADFSVGLGERSSTRSSEAQRLLSRPWNADPFLKEIILQLVEKKHSVARLIANSPQIKELCNDFRSKSTEPVKIGKAIRDLAFAPQRYSSEAKVLARLVLTWDAVPGVLTSVPTI